MILIDLSVKNVVNNSTYHIITNLFRKQTLYLFKNKLIAIDFGFDLYPTCKITIN